MAWTKVSVVVPVHNPENAIDACLESLLLQTTGLGELDVVLVDDGSTDGTPGRLREVVALHPHVRVVTIPNSGWPGRLRNVGVAVAGGEYVQFVDQDDGLAPRSWTVSTPWVTATGPTS